MQKKKTLRTKLVCAALLHSTKPNSLLVNVLSVNPSLKNE